MWNKLLKFELKKLGFMAGDADNMVFSQYGISKSIEIARWYVDDGLLAADSPESMDQMIRDIRGSFDIQDLGEPERLLGVKIVRDRNKGHIHISQPTYIDSLTKRFKITPRKSISTPMETNVDLQASTLADNTENILYASLIGSINYCTIFTRPNISFATNKCAQFTSKPTDNHWEAAKCILCYLIHTRNHGILYKSHATGITGCTHNLTGFTDVDFAGDMND